MNTKLIGTMVAVFATGLATAATESRMTGGSNSSSTYTDNGKWSGGVAPGNSGNGNYDYVVANGYALRWNESSTTTVGGNSLTLGDDTTSGSITWKGDNRYVYFPDLRVKRGSISQGSNGWMGMAGNVTLYTPADNPFVIWKKGDKDCYFYMKLTGDESSVIKLRSGGADKAYYPYADQSATYSGSWILDSNVYFRPMKKPGQVYSGAPCANETSAQVFGKPLSTFNPRALVAYTNVNIRYEASKRTFAASDNRGLTLVAKGSKVLYTMVNGDTHSFGWPIAGEGTFELTNSGRFYLRAQCAVDLKAASSSTKVFLCDGAEITSTGSLTVRNGGDITFEKATDRVTVSNPNLKDPTLVFVSAADGSYASQLRLAGTMAIDGKIALKLSQLPAVTSATDLPLVVVDSAVTRTFVPSDFIALVPNATEVVVTRDATTHDQVVSLHLVPVVKSVYELTKCAIADNWTDKKVPHAGADYVILSGHNLRSDSDTEGKEFAFAGDSMVLQGSITSKNTRYTVHNMIGLAGATFTAAGYYGYGGVYQGLAGELEVRTTDASPFNFNIARSAGVLESTTTGTGRIRVYCSDESTQARSFEITGDVSGYAGYWSFNNATSVVDNTFAYKIHSEDELGTPETFAANALLLGYGCVVTPQADVTIDDATRGVTFASAKPGADKAARGVGFNLLHDFTVKTPVVFQAGTFAVNGTGTLAFGAGGVTAASGTTLSIGARAAVKPQGANALKGLALTLADGACLAFDAAVGAVDFTQTTLTMPTGGSYYVRIDGLKERTPIATFATAEIAAAVVASAKVRRGSRYKGYLVAEGATVFADVNGFLIIAR